MTSEAHASAMRALYLMLCVFGISVSLYSLHVKHSAAADENYRALCDISEHMSCSKVLTSDYSRGFGVAGQILGEDSPLNASNSVHGVVFYSFLFLLGYLDWPSTLRVILVLSIAANLMSIYLASILYFVLHDFCLVCVTTYLINFSLLVISYSRSAFHQQQVFLGEWVGKSK
ncbi:vitamin K epoxide reductase complex subunit 1 [Galendromus occidentalis]|uniref:vitamin-K-epoxide reductase (warfarin-sensitive) n=1 Tax=Galendromus occidentalis TaxID=34638 RepID=A0AAJ6QTI1_9ACAR|nr:vitamin K epoxide reductase complex subunit 1 [Galendromus occidentalis]